MTAVEPCGYRGDDVLPWRGSDKSSSVLVTPEQHFPNSSTTSKLLSMPLVKIDMIKGVRTPQEIKKLADVVQKVMLEHFNAPPRDRYQVPSTQLGNGERKLATSEEYSFNTGRL